MTYSKGRTRPVRTGARANSLAALDFETKTAYTVVVKAIRGLSDTIDVSDRDRSQCTLNRR